MLRSKKPKKNFKADSKEIPDKRRTLGVIDENATMQIGRTDQHSVSSTQDGRTVEERLEDMFGSQDNIPASQEPFCRYLSQRSNFTTTLQRTQSLTAHQPNTYFELVLMKAGVKLEDNSDNFVLSCDHVSFVNKFRDLFIKAQHFPDNVNTFCTGLRDALSTRSKLTQKLLTGCTIKVPEVNIK